VKDSMSGLVAECLSSTGCKLSAELVQSDDAGSRQDGREAQTKAMSSMAGLRIVSLTPTAGSSRESPVLGVARGDTELLCTCGGLQGQAHAEEIVHALGAHGPLVAALRLMKTKLSREAELAGDGKLTVQFRDEELARIIDALALAEVEVDA